MEAKELRIGNKVLFYGEIDTIIEIGQAGNGFCENNDYFNFDKFTVEPIPLTEEWLLNFGFEVYRFGFKENQYRLKDRLIVIRNGLFCDYGTSVIIKHVHQLQNLYFALTGEELTLSK